MVLIYAHEISPRLEYTARLIFHDILGTEVTCTADRDVFTKSDFPKINYSSSRFGDELFISAGNFLFSRSLQVPEVFPIPFDQEAGFFETSPDSFLPFDPFASAFLIVSRMEEYTTGYRDQHGRFPATLSILFRNNLLEKPVVDRWAFLIASKIKEKYPVASFPTRPFRFLSTIDVDNARAYLHKGFVRSTAAFARDLLSGSFRKCFERFRVLTGIIPDPYATEKYLFSFFNGREKHVRFFFLLGDRAKFDKQLSWKIHFLREMIRKIHLRFAIGIHPSYLAHKTPGIEKLKKEKERLEKIIGSQVISSRQHYLLQQFPDSYKRLLAAGITEDYSMGFPDLPGFRAGTCTPHHWYDLTRDVVTPLMIYPFQVMDVTLRQYLDLSPSEASRKIEKLMNEVRATGGLFCGIWHNESVSGFGTWKDYRQVFESMNQRGFEYAEK